MPSSERITAVVVLGSLFLIGVDAWPVKRSRAYLNVQSVCVHAMCNICEVSGTVVQIHVFQKESPRTMLPPLHLTVIFA